MRNTFIQTLIEEAKKDERIFLLTPDMGYSVLEPFQELFPERFLNIGIAEQNAIGIASGLALSGCIVYVYSIVPFVTMRCFEQVRVDVAYMRTNVRLIGVGAGYSYGAAGSTHHSIEDIAIMRVLPNMTVCCPGDPAEVREIVQQSVCYDGPMYIRLGKSGEPQIHAPGTEIQIGKAIVVEQGEDISIIATSNMLELAMTWRERWELKGVSASVISMPTIKPFDKAIVMDLIQRGKPIYTLEEHNIIGGLGSAVAEVIAESGIGVKFKRMGIPDSYTHLVGSQTFLRDQIIIKYLDDEME